MARGLIACVLFVAACSKSDAPADKPAKAPADKPTAEKAPAEPAVTSVDKAPPAKIKQATNSADLAKLPVDSEIVVGVNVTAVKASPLWQTFVEPRMGADVKAKLDEFKQKCDIDPLAVVKSASVGLKDTPGGKEGVIVVHGPEKAKIAACAEKMKADKDAKVEITIDGDTTILKPKTGGIAVAFQFISDTDAVIAIGSKADATGLKAIVGGQGLASSNAFVEIYNRIETEKTLWLLMNGKNEAFKPLAMAGIKPSSVFASVDATSGINLDLRMRLASQDQATQSATMMKTQLGPAAGMLKMDKLDVSADGQDLKFIMVVSAANLGPMMATMQGMAGGAMGGAQ